MPRVCGETMCKFDLGASVPRWGSRTCAGPGGLLPRWQPHLLKARAALTAARPEGGRRDTSVPVCVHDCLCDVSPPPTEAVFLFPPATPGLT